MLCTWSRWVRSLIHSAPKTKIQKRPTVRLDLEGLEAREVPNATLVLSPGAIQFTGGANTNLTISVSTSEYSGGLLIYTFYDSYEPINVQTPSGEYAGTTGPIAVGAGDVFGGNGTNTVQVSYTNYFSQVEVQLPSVNNTVNVLSNTLPLSILGSANTTAVEVGGQVGSGGTQAGIQSPVNVSGANTLIVDDSADTTSHTNVALSNGSITGLGGATIGIGTGVGQVNVYGGSGVDTFTVNDPGPFQTNLFTGTGSDNVNVLATSGQLYVIGGTGLGTVCVGSTGINQNDLGTQTSIQGNVSVSASPGATAILQVDDRGDTSSNTFTLSDGSITDSDGATISIGEGVDQVGVYGGTGTDTFTVNDPGPFQTSLFTGTSPDTVNVFAASNEVSIITTNGPMFWMTSANDLYGQNGDGPSYLISQNVESFTLAADSTLYVLQFGGQQSYLTTSEISSTQIVAPSFTATAASAAEIDLSWTPVAGATEYQINEWCWSSDTWQQIGTGDADSTSYSATGLLPNTTYDFNVGTVTPLGIVWAANYQSTTTLALSTPTLNVSGGTFTFNDAPQGATGNVMADGVSMGTPTFTYYAGTSATGTPLSGAPVYVGTYTVVASFAGNENYTPAESAVATIVITKAAPTLSVGGGTFTFNDTANPATASATGLNETSLSGLIITYYAGTSVTGTPLSSAPIYAGTYTAVANFPVHPNYTAAQSAPVTIVIAKAAPTLSIEGGTFTFNDVAHPVTASATGVNGTPLSGLTIAYYAGTSATGTPLSGAPIYAGTYTAVANFPAHPNYSPAQSAPVMIVIAKTAPTISVAGGTFTFDGAAHPATGSATGVNGTILNGLTFTYYAGTSTTGTPLSGPPVNPGTYTAVANFPVHPNYTAAQSAPVTIVITNAAPAFSALSVPTSDADDRDGE
jgi:hypothetical protein